MKFEFVHGLIFGLLSLASIGIYILMDVNLFNPVTSLIATIVTFGFLIYAGLKKRKLEGGYLDYGSAVKSIFIIALVGSIISGVGTTALLADSEKAKQDFVELSTKSSEFGYKLGAKMSGASEEEAALKLEEAKEKRGGDLSKGQMDYPFSWSALPLSLVMNLFMVLFYSLLIALFVRKNPASA